MQIENKTFDIKNISVEFGTNCVFRDFSLALPEGKITCVLGPSGAGKTTLLKVLGGILPAKDFSAPKCSFIFQDHRLLPHLTALPSKRMESRCPRPSLKGKLVARIMVAVAFSLASEALNS